MKKMRSSLLLTGLIAAALPLAASAEAPGVAPLLQQAHYWLAKGRGDLARQAYTRILAIDPGHEEAKKALAGSPPQIATAKAPLAEQPKSAAVPATPAKAAGEPRRPVQSDRGGDARAAGFRALDGGDLATAAARFRAAIAINGNDADALGGLGVVRLKERKFAEARDLLTRASRRGSASKWVEALAAARFYAGLDEARAALDAGDLDKAGTLAQGLAASGFADRAPAQQLLAEIYERQGRYAEAAELYKQAGGSAAAGSDAAGSAARAQALAASEKGNDLLAEQLLRQAMAAHPDDPWIAYELARLLHRRGRPAEADAIIQSLSRSARPDAIYAAALLCDQSDRTGEAQSLMARIPDAQRSAEMRGFAAGLETLATIAKARALGQQGRAPQAMAMLRELAGTPGLSAGKKGAIAQALFDLGDTASASALAQEALSAPANDPGDYDSLVRLFAHAGQDGFAMAAVQKASALAGGSAGDKGRISALNATLVAAQADRLRLAGQFAQAFDMLQAAWNDAPGNGEILGTLARLYQSGGLYPQAEQTFRMLLAQNPGDKGALLGLIDSASSAGDMDMARSAAQQAISVHPDDYEVYMAAARMEQARGNQSAALRYLKVARQLYLRQTGLAANPLLASNPFAAMPQGNNPFRAAAPQPVNPFALGTGKAQVSPLGAPTYPAYPAYTAAGAAGPTYPAPTYAAPAYPAQGQPMPGYATAAARPAYPVAGEAPLGIYAAQSQVPAAATTTTFADPVLNGIEQDMQTLQSDSAPRVDVSTSYRSRSGETGLSRLRDLGGSAAISTGLAGGRVGVKASAVVLDAGRPTGSGLARFGRNATAEAQGIVAQQPSQLTGADTQHASGVALSGSYESSLVKLEAGTTPLGFDKSHVTGKVELDPRFSPSSSARLWAERKPVTDSVLSYAGTRDPVTGAFWGAVMKSGGGLSLSYDRNGSGVYADASYYHYDGTNVRDNQGIEVNAGGYLRAWQDAYSGISAGFNANFQNYDNNQNFFTFGHGGYFSPQSFLSVNFPVRYWMRKGPLSIDADVAPGYQSYDQRAEALYPTDPAAQGLLDFLKTQDSDVRSRYDSISKTGFGISGAASLYYAISANTRVGGELNVNTFGEYKEFKSLLGIKQVIGGK